MVATFCIEKHISKIQMVEIIIIKLKGLAPNQSLVFFKPFTR